MHPGVAAVAGCTRSPGLGHRVAFPKTSNSKTRIGCLPLSKEKWLRALAILKIAAYTGSAQNVAHPLVTIRATSRHARRTLAGTGLGRQRLATRARAPKATPTPPIVIPDPAVPPAPTQASGLYNHGQDFAADRRLVPPPRRSDAAGPFAVVCQASSDRHARWQPCYTSTERAPRGLDLAELSIYSFIP
jgi:hypothetical protein